MSRHIPKIYGISIVAALTILIPLFVVLVLEQIIGNALLKPTDSFLLYSGNPEDLGKFFGKFAVYLLIYAALHSLVFAFFWGGIYGSSIQAVFEGYTTVGNFFRWGWHRYGKMYGFLFLITFLLNIYIFIALDHYYSVMIGMAEVGLSVIIDILLFIVFVLFMIIYFCSPVYIMKEGAGVFRSLLLPFKTFGKSLLSATLSFLVFFAITLLYFIPGFFIIGITEPNLQQASVDNLVTDALVMIILLLYFIFVFPLCCTLSVLITVNRYKNRIRPALFGETPMTQPYVPGGVSYPYHPTQPITPYPPQPRPIQPTEPEPPKFTFQIPDSNSNGQTKQDVDEDTGRFTF